MCLEFYESIHMALILVNLRLLVIKQRVQLCSYKLGKKTTGREWRRRRAQDNLEDNYIHQLAISCFT